jgi:hypothetical protein
MILSGLCPFCSGAADPGRVRCLKCSATRKKNRKQKKHKGICADCSNRITQGTYRCVNCLWSRCIINKGFSETEEKRAWAAVRKFKNSCQCCGAKSARGQGKFHIDHKDGKFRGILCHRCNVVLGLLEENFRIIRCVSAYIKRVKSC